MRIISGQFKGFVYPNHKLGNTRPTTDRAKEALFNILENKIDLTDIRVLDLYSGTGNLTFEALSRGAGEAVMVEFNRSAVNYIRSVAERLKLNPVVVQSKVLPALSRLQGKFDLVFADPPYNSPDYAVLLDKLLENELLKPGAIVVVEHASQLKLEHRLLTDRRQYGQSTFSFFTFES